VSCGVIEKQIKENGWTAGTNVLEDISLNFSGAGIHTKITSLKKDMVVFQHKHVYDHLSVLLDGTVVLETDEGKGFGPYLMVAKDEPVSIVIKAGIYHKVSALTDATWMCIHNQKEDEIPLE
jgi:quercetin dioxygenase-like cupin family protein